MQTWPNQKSLFLLLLTISSIICFYIIISIKKTPVKPITGCYFIIRMVEYIYLHQGPTVPLNSIKLHQIAHIQISVLEIFHPDP